MAATAAAVGVAPMVDVKVAPIPPAAGGAGGAPIPAATADGAGQWWLDPRGIPPLPPGTLPNPQSVFYWYIEYREIGTEVWKPDPHQQFHNAIGRREAIAVRSLEHSERARERRRRRHARYAAAARAFNIKQAGEVATRTLELADPPSWMDRYRPVKRRRYERTGVSGLMLTTETRIVETSVRRASIAPFQENDLADSFDLELAAVPRRERRRRWRYGPTGKPKPVPDAKAKNPYNLPPLQMDEEERLTDTADADFDSSEDDRIADLDRSPNPDREYSASSDSEADDDYRSLTRPTDVALICTRGREGVQAFSTHGGNTPVHLSECHTLDRLLEAGWTLDPAMKTTRADARLVDTPYVVGRKKLMRRKIPKDRSAALTQLRANFNMFNTQNWHYLVYSNQNSEQFSFADLLPPVPASAAARATTSVPRKAAAPVTGAAVAATNVSVPAAAPVIRTVSNCLGRAPEVPPVLIPAAVPPPVATSLAPASTALTVISKAVSQAGTSVRSAAASAAVAAPSSASSSNVQMPPAAAAAGGADLFAPSRRVVSESFLPSGIRHRFDSREYYAHTAPLSTAHTLHEMCWECAWRVPGAGTREVSRVYGGGMYAVSERAWTVFELIAYTRFVCANGVSCQPKCAPQAPTAVDLFRRAERVPLPPPLFSAPALSTANAAAPASNVTWNPVHKKHTRAGMPVQSAAIPVSSSSSSSSSSSLAAAAASSSSSAAPAAGASGAESRAIQFSSATPFSLSDRKSRGVRSYWSRHAYSWMTPTASTAATAELARLNAKLAVAQLRSPKTGGATVTTGMACAACTAPPTNDESILRLNPYHTGGGLLTLPQTRCGAIAPRLFFTATRHRNPIGRNALSENRYLNLEVESFFLSAVNARRIGMPRELIQLVVSYALARYEVRLAFCEAPTRDY